MTILLLSLVAHAAEYVNEVAQRQAIGNG